MNKTTQLLVNVLQAKHLPGQHDQKHHGRPGDQADEPQETVMGGVLGRQAHLDQSLSDEEASKRYNEYQTLMGLVQAGGYGVPPEDLETVEDILSHNSIMGNLPNYVTAHEAHVLDCTAMGQNDMGDGSITLVPAFVDKTLRINKDDTGYLDKHNRALDAVDEHEVWHRVFPGNMEDAMFLIACVSAGLHPDVKEELQDKRATMHYANWYADMIVNYLSYRKTKSEGFLDIYKSMTKEAIEEHEADAARRKAEGLPEKPLDEEWAAYMRAHENLFQVPPGTLIPSKYVTNSADKHGRAWASIVKAKIDSDPFKGATMFAFDLSQLLDKIVSDTAIRQKQERDKKGEGSPSQGKPQQGKGGENQGGGSSDRSKPGEGGGHPGQPKPGGGSSKPGDVTEPGKPTPGGVGDVPVKEVEDYTPEEWDKLVKQQQAREDEENAAGKKLAQGEQKTEEDLQREANAKAIADEIMRSFSKQQGRALDTIDPARDLEAKDRQTQSARGGKGIVDRTNYIPPELTSPTRTDIFRQFDSAPEGMLRRVADVYEKDIIDIDPTLRTARERQDAIRRQMRGQADGGGSNVSPAAYYQALLDMGYQVSETAAVMKYYEEMAKRIGLIPFPTGTGPGEVTVHHGYDVWDPIEDEASTIDPFNTARLGAGLFIPGHTTYGKKSKKSVGRSSAKSKRPMNLTIYADCSWSTPNPKKQLCHTTLAAMVLALSALRAGSSVRFAKFSDPSTGVRSTEEYTRDKRKILAVGTEWLGGSTDLPVELIRKDAKELYDHGRRNKDTIIAIISDYDIAGPTQEGRIAKLLEEEEGFGAGVTFLNSPKAREESDIMGPLMRSHGWDRYTVGSKEDVVAAAKDYAHKVFGNKIKKKKKSKQEPL